MSNQSVKSVFKVKTSFVIVRTFIQPFVFYFSIIYNKIHLKQETCPCVHSGHRSKQVIQSGWEDVLSLL